MALLSQPAWLPSEENVASPVVTANPVRGIWPIT
jgi:hypothetical protein